MDQALADFLRHLGLEKNASAHTVKSYREDLTQAVAFFRERAGAGAPPGPDRRPACCGPSWPGCTTRATPGPRSPAGSRPSAPGAGSCAGRGSLESNPADGLRGPKLDSKLPHFLNKADVDAAAGRPARPTPPWACATGPSWKRSTRPACGSASWSGWNWTTWTSAEGVATVRGKGKRERLALHRRRGQGGDLASGCEARTALLEGIGRRSQTALFLNRNGTRLSTRSVGRLAGEVPEAAGLDPRTTPAHPAAHVRHPPARRRGRHPRRAGAARPQEPDAPPRSTPT